MGDNNIANQEEFSHMREKLVYDMQNTEQESILFNDVCGIIDNVRGKIAEYVNTQVCLTKWYVGNRIKEDVLFNKRADYGKQVVKRLAVRLSAKYGNGWSDRSLLHCIRAAYTFTKDEIIYATRIQLSWTHLRSLMFIDDPLARQFYIEMCQLENWNTRTLTEKIDSMLYERTAISRRPEDVIKKQLEEVRETKLLTPDLVFRSTYFLEMLGLPDEFAEDELETAIVKQIEAMMAEFGGEDLALIKRQKRIVVDGVTYKADLVFFHRSLRRTIVVDLKIGRFKPEHEGQMLLYLRYINRHERHDWEESPIGIILCSEGNTEHIEYLMLDENSPIKVAQYYTKLPDKKLLAERLKRAIEIAREYQLEKKQRGK